MKTALLLLLFFNLSAAAQKLPGVNFNHFYLVIDSADLVAIQQSVFMKNDFGAMITKTTKADSGITWTGTYLFGTDSYFEIFDPNGAGAPLGYAGIAFSVDRVGQLQQLDSILSKKYKTGIELREKQIDDKKIPWFTSLYIDDSAFYEQSDIYWWVMEYKPEYYDYNKWRYDSDRLTRTTYLSEYAEKRKGKIFKRFTGIILKTTTKESDMLKDFLLNCGYKKIDENNFESPENFIIQFKERNKDDRYAVEMVLFECNKPHNGIEKISNHIQIEFKNNSGKIVFK